MTPRFKIILTIGFLGLWLLSLFFLRPANDLAIIFFLATLWGTLFFLFYIFFTQPLTLFLLAGILPLTLFLHNYLLVVTILCFTFYLRLDNKKHF